MFWNKKWKNECKELKSLYEDEKEHSKELEKSKNDVIESLYARIDEQNRERSKLEKEIKDLNGKLENKQAELDKLYKYYDLNEPASQETKTAVRIDKRVHDLELENIRLNSLLESIYTSLNNMVYYQNSQMNNCIYQNYRSF